MTSRGVTAWPALRYLSKLPPSPSGIGLYAREFLAALRATRLEVQVCRAPADPAVSQEFRQALAGFRLGRRLGADAIPLHVELSGRALFEFYAALGCLSRRDHPAVSITCHDAPSVAGAVLLFRGLDRRGLRRLTLACSTRLGFQLERRVVSRAEVVVALTAAGAGALQRRHGRPVTHIPHLVPSFPPGHKDPCVFLPGYLGDAERIAALVAMVLEAAPTGWTVRIGSCPDETRALLSDEPRVSFTGHLDEDALLAEFARAALVVRDRPDQPDANAFAASGPLSWALASGCHCLTNDRRAGAQELAALGLVELVTDLPAALRTYFQAQPEGSLNPPPVAGADSLTARQTLSSQAVASRFRAALAH